MISLGLSILYAILWPKSIALHVTTWQQRIVLRWAHSLVWALLTLQFALRGTSQPWAAPVASLVALQAAAIYAVFIFTLTTTAREL